LWTALHGENPPEVIDVREPREYQRGHIPEAHSIPLHELLNNFPHHINLTDEIILVCRSGRRSTRAACILKEQGVENLSVVEGGMLSWEAINLLEAIDE
jgi:SulP family sulfate permease